MVKENEVKIAIKDKNHPNVVDNCRLNLVVRDNWKSTQGSPLKSTTDYIFHFKALKI